MPRPRPGDLQLAILDVLWQRGEATVAEVHAALVDSRGLAVTTIATMLRKMADRGLAAQRRDGRTLVYRAAVGRDVVHRSMVEDLIDRVFAGDPTRLVSHLIEAGDLGSDDLARLRRRVAAARDRRASGGGR
ncbi:MAG: BlaI/MecI/CopY family transcriptional regulator [Planctomycetes bacterium]|nr:BlaI/MecI/CopY family transcriptional regulator [Planctomycetota bacterium]